MERVRYGINTASYSVGDVRSFGCLKDAEEFAKQRARDLNRPVVIWKTVATVQVAPVEEMRVTVEMHGG